VTARIDATPEAVLAVLADGWLYSNRVVCTSHGRAVEASWPIVRLHHAPGVWPAVARDETVVEDVDPGRRVMLVARGRPLGGRGPSSSSRRPGAAR
jgi:hypothetical protein